MRENECERALEESDIAEEVGNLPEAKHLVRIRLAKCFAKVGFRRYLRQRPEVFRSVFIQVNV